MSFVLVSTQISDETSFPMENYSMGSVFVPKIDNALLASSEAFTPDGASLKLGQLWQKRPVIFIFLRHFACIACRAHAADVWAKREAYGKVGNLIFIGNGDPAYIDSFKESLGMEKAIILTDPSLQSFKAAGFHYGFKYIVRLNTLKASKKLLQQGHRYGKYSKKSGTKWQLGGILAVNTKGVVTYQYISETIDDFPEEPHFDTIVKDEKSTDPE